jgi:hypothetical protein
MNIPFVLRSVSTALLTGVMWSSLGATPVVEACYKCEGTGDNHCDDGYVNGSTTCTSVTGGCVVSGDCRSA